MPFPVRESRVFMDMCKPLRPWNNSDWLCSTSRRPTMKNVSCRDWGIKHQLRPEERFANHPKSCIMMSNAVSNNSEAIHRGEDFVQQDLEWLWIR